MARADVETLVERGLLSATGEFHGCPLYDVDSADALDDTVLRQIVTARENWLKESVDERTAANILQLQPREFRKLAVARKVVAGRFGRYLRREIEDLNALQKLDVNRAATKRRADLRAAVAHWAEQMLSAGTAVILDVETAAQGWGICEIAVVAAWSGEVLMDTLINPDMPISAAARRVHGISETDVHGAPSIADVLPALLAVTAGRRVLAYNSEYDRLALRADCDRKRLDLGELSERDNWSCLMAHRMDWLGTDKALSLGGGHRSRVDCLTARELLRDLASRLRASHLDGARAAPQ